MPTPLPPARPPSDRMRRDTRKTTRTGGLSPVILFSAPALSLVGQLSRRYGRSRVPASTHEVCERGASAPYLLGAARTGRDDPRAASRPRPELPVRDRHLPGVIDVIDSSAFAFRDKIEKRRRRKVAFQQCY